MGVRRYPSRGISVLFFPPSSMQCWRRQISHTVYWYLLYCILHCPNVLCVFCLMNSLNEYNKSILLPAAFGLFIATDNGWIVTRCKSVACLLIQNGEHIPHFLFGCKCLPLKQRLNISTTKGQQMSSDHINDFSRGLSGFVFKMYLLTEIERVELDRWQTYKISSCYRKAE